MASINQFLNSLRAEFGEQEAGKKFETFCKWFLENDPEWSKRVDTVWLWDDYPNKWQREDLGTDLVFKDKDGLIWAVQAKCYSEERATIKKHMDSFLADSGRRQVKRRLWFQTTNKMEAKAIKTLTGQEKPVTVFSLRDFQQAQIDYPNSYGEFTKSQAQAKPKPIPDEHQIEAIQKVKSKLPEFNRGQLIMACGTGKTFTTLWIKEELNAQTTLVLLPSLNLLSQTMREWAWASNADFEILNVCSDKTISRKSEEDLKLSDAPFPVTSAVSKIAEFIKKPVPKVVFCTYQSSTLIAEAQLDSSVPDFDLAIADEAHRCAGKVNANFATILAPTKIRAQKRLFTTATPRYFGRAIKQKADERALTIVDMNDEEVFGPVIHKLTFGEAIRRDLLNDYQVVIVGVDEPMIKEMIDDAEIVALNTEKETDARTLAAKIGVIKAIKDYDLAKIISFHNLVKRAREFSEEFIDVINLIDPTQRPEGRFLVNYVSGEMNANDRKDKIDKLRKLEGYDRGILTNARCLAEGVDIPSLDGVAFIDPKGSQIEIIQAVGRAIRKVRGAKIQSKGTIVIPVFIEDGDVPEDRIEASNFKPVWDVLKALRAHDEVLAETLDQCRTQMAKAGSKFRHDAIIKTVFDLPVSVDANFPRALTTHLIESTTDSWEHWFGLLEVYKERNGDTLVPKNHITDCRRNLGIWVNQQRWRGGANKLTSDQIERLNRLGFIWNTYDEEWRVGYENIKAFYQEFGNSDVPSRFVTSNGHNLGSWVVSQRSRKDSLPAEKVKMLEEIDFCWDINTKLWEAGYLCLIRFKEQSGHCNVSSDYESDEGYKLGSWVRIQRQNYKNLDASRIARLDSLGFIWNLKEYTFNSRFSQLVEYKNRVGDTNVKKDYRTEDGFLLANWVRRLRYSKHNLTETEVKRLDDLGFIWDHLDDQTWNIAFERLQSYKENNGDCDVPSTYKSVDGFSLGTWVRKQRTRKERLSQEQTDKLNRIGFLWLKNSDQAWKNALEELERYKEEYGDCNVPAKHKTASGFRLGSWAANQRTRRDRLSKSQEAQLNSLGFVWNILEESWEQSYSALKTYKTQFGNCNVSYNYVTKDGIKLGVWATIQRQTLGEMNPARRKRLDDLGFIWNVKESAWLSAYLELTAYHKEFGDCLVKQKYKTKTGFKLGQWVSIQRASIKTIPKDRKEKLDRIDFIWDVPQYEWDQGLKRLVKYKEEYGHCDVPVRYTTDDGYPLGKWVFHRRNLKSRLPKQKIVQLEKLGFVWKKHERKHYPGTKEDRWKLYAKALEAFIKEFDHANVPDKYRSAEGLRIASWLTKQKKKWGDGILSKDKIDYLVNLGIDPEIPSDKYWNDRLSLLERFKTHHGNLDMTRETIFEGRNIYSIVANMRARRDSYTAAQLSQLADLGIELQPRTANSRLGLEKYEKYIRSGKDLLITITYKTDDGFPLGNWIAAKRAERKQGKLNPNVESKLNQIGIIWEPDEYRWSMGYSELQDYYKDNGNCSVPDGFVSASGYRLGQWLRMQKSKYKKAKLREDRLKKLSDICNDWKV